MTYKNNLVNQIRDFIRVLEEHCVIASSSPLHELIRGLERTTESKGLSYRLIELKFLKVSSKQLIASDKWDGDSLSVYLNVHISLTENGEFRFGDVDSSVIEIVYETLSEETIELARGAWHLDYHMDKPGSNKPHFLHPSYHFHHGGRAIKDTISNYGEIVLMDAPRVMHPPLDLFLAVDFLLTNFLEKRVWSNVRADTTYQEIVQQSQKNWWKEYFQQIGEYWNHLGMSGNESVNAREAAKLANPYLF